MAPEIIQNKRYGQKVDIWGLGCVCLELIHGTTPNPKMSTMNALFHTGTVGVPENKWPTKTKWSRDFKNFLTELLHPHPDRRPSAKELLYVRLFINLL